MFIFSEIDQDDLAMVAEKLRAGVERMVIRWQDRKLCLTVSIGGSMLVDGDTRETILERADQRLYASKREGRNQITLEDEKGGPEGRTAG